MHKNFLILTLCGYCLLAAPSTVLGQEDSADIQACTSHKQCALVEASCQSSCDVMPVNRNHAESVRKGRAEICGAQINAMPVCRTRPVLSAACINGRCTIGEAYKAHASRDDYEQPHDDAWYLERRYEGWDKQGFTAYDLPQEIVKTGRLELRKR